MYSKYILMIGYILLLTACSEMTLNEDFSKSTAKNRALQTIDLTAETEQRPVATLDGQKATKLVKEYRQETPKAADEQLTK